MERIEGAFSKNVLQQGKLAGSPIPAGHRELVNNRTVTDLVNLRDRCLAEKIDIQDLQFMIAQDGSIRVIDPARVTWLGGSDMKPRKIREQMKLFEKRINDVISKTRDIAAGNVKP